ncbi:TetR/AcrR family transcriptional regulator [Geothrix oryzisoli]|uniref:TetR/AcrR family transcriptional regulator n=1 Tax=Geothrix oryzisoli TaxID=2922721 RepID=UPI001FAD089E|nr:TetR/AcrR family transcriptional regulator [Geothrix oryzisoli]
MDRSTLELTPKRAEIADAALRIIETRGIAALTTSALASELGVSSGAPFRHIANREELLEAVVLRVEELILGTFPRATDPPLERIQSLIRARAKVIGGHRGIGRLMFSEQFALALPEAAAVRLRGVVTRTQAFLLEALREAQQQEAVRTDLPPKALVTVVFGLLMHLVYAQAAGQGRATDPGETCATLLALLQPPSTR